MAAAISAPCLSGLARDRSAIGHQKCTICGYRYQRQPRQDSSCGPILPRKTRLAVARDASRLRQQQEFSVQLQDALKSRVVIEQAKGITAQQHAVTVNPAYQLTRAHARNNNVSLRTVAEAIVEVGLQI